PRRAWERSRIRFYWGILGINRGDLPAAARRMIRVANRTCNRLGRPHSALVVMHQNRHGLAKKFLCFTMLTRKLMHAFSTNV
ncbi:MAG: hypothetical protein ACKN9T_08950, partial [Candidatus Methylumidiphilus sp.]